MNMLDWHGGRSDLSGLALLNMSPTDAEIDLATVQAYRLGRLRDEMAQRDISALILSDSDQHPLRHRDAQHAGVLSA